MVQKRRKQFNVPVIFRVGLLIIALAVTFFTVSRVNAIIEVPPNNDIFFQTTGRDADLGVGDFYTNVGGDKFITWLKLTSPAYPTRSSAFNYLTPNCTTPVCPGKFPL